MFEEKISPSPYYRKPPMHFKNYDIFYNQDYNLSKISSNKHNYYEFYFLLSGNVTYYVEDLKYSLSSGDIVLISPNQEHHAVINNEANVPYERYVLWLSPTFVDSMSSSHTNLSFVFQTSCIINSKIQLPHDLLVHIKHLFKCIFINSKSQQYGSDLLAKAYITELLVHLAQSSLFCSNSILEHCQSEPLSKDTSLILKVLRYIDEHIYESIHINEICKHFFISRSYLSKVFSSEIEIPIYQYIIKKKLFLVQQDIVDGLPLQEICEKYNFGNYSSFYKAFRAEFGQSPKEFKNKGKNEFFPN